MRSLILVVVVLLMASAAHANDAAGCFPLADKMYCKQADGSYTSAPIVNTPSVQAPAPVVVVTAAPAYVTIQCWQSSIFGGYWRYFTVPAGMSCPAEYVYPPGISVTIWGRFGGYHRHH